VALFRPYGASIDFCVLTHGLRRGLWCFRPYGASEWPADPKRCSFRPRGCAAGAWGAAMKNGRAPTPALRPFHSRGYAAGVWGTITKPLRNPRVAMPRERVVIAFFKRRRRDSTRAYGVSRGYCGGVRSSPGGAKEKRERATAVALFRPLRGFDRFLRADPRLTPWTLVLSPLRGFRMARGPATLLVSSEGVRRRRVGSCYAKRPSADACTTPVSFQGVRRRRVGELFRVKAITPASNSRNTFNPRQILSIPSSPRY